MDIPGGWELVLILAVLVLLFGTRKLPDAARSLGRSMRIFKSEVKGLRNDDEPTSPTETDAERDAREFQEWKAQRATERSSKLL